MNNFLSQIKHFSVEPAVRNLYRNDEQKRLGEQTAYSRERDKLGDFRFDQRLKQQNEDRAYQRGRQVKADQRSDQLFGMKLGQIREQKAADSEKTQQDKIAALIYASKTPELYKQNISKLRASGLNIGAEYDDFSQRANILAEHAGLQHVKDFTKKEKPTSLMQNLSAAGVQPGTPEYKNAILGGTSKGVTINNQLPGAGKGTNKLTEKLAEQAASVFDQAASAQDLYGKYAQINEYAQDPNVRTGTLGSAELAIKKLGNTVFGMEFKGLPEAEQIQKVGDLLVGDIRKLQGDTRLSDADRRAYRAIPPNLGDSKQSVMLATEIMRKTAEGMAKRQKYLSQLMTNNSGLFDANVWAQYNQYINQNPLITKEDVLKARSLSHKAKQNTPGAGMLDQINKELLRRGVK